MRALWFMLLLLITAHAVTGQAPGDEDQLCIMLPTREPFLNQVVLMSSLNYDTILAGGPWIVLNEDNNNDGRTFSSQTTVSEILSEFFIFYRYFSGQHQAHRVVKLLLCADFRLAHKAIGLLLNLSTIH